MKWLGDGHWLRQFAGQPDYHLRRIVQADGKTRDPAYADYVKRFGPQAVINVTAQVLKDGQSVSFHVPGGERDYVLEVMNDSDQAGAFQVVAEAATPLSIKVMQSSVDGQVLTDKDGKTLTLLMKPTNYSLSARQIVLVNTKSGQPADVKLSMKKISTPVLKQRQHLTVSLPGGSSNSYVALSAPGNDGLSPYQIVATTDMQFRMQTVFADDANIRAPDTSGKRLQFQADGPLRNILVLASDSAGSVDLALDTIPPQELSPAAPAQVTVGPGLSAFFDLKPDGPNGGYYRLTGDSDLPLAMQVTDPFGSIGDRNASGSRQVYVYFDSQERHQLVISTDAPKYRQCCGEYAEHPVYQKPTKAPSALMARRWRMR